VCKTRKRKASHFAAVFREKSRIFVDFSAIPVHHLHVIECRTTPSDGHEDFAASSPGVHFCDL
jgi:hypothetical protein